ncbi:hypothetical protein GCM10027592_15180 [Spirosoma flavus]
MNTRTKIQTTPNETAHTKQSFRSLSQRITNYVTAAILALLLVVTGCKKPIVDPVDTLVANAGPDQAVQVGQPATLDGTASRDPQAKPLTYQWMIVRKPVKSAVTLTTVNTARLTFTPDEVGEYEFALTVSNGMASQSDNVLVLASVAQPLTIDKDITVKTVLEDRILNPELPDYIVSKSIAVKHELTINPGVVIAFERDVRFDINDKGGLLIARGTADKKIRFVGVTRNKGYWAGIMHYSPSNANVMEHVEVLHAGSKIMLDDKKAGMTMFKESQMAFSNVHFSESAGYGLFVAEDALLREFATNTFSNNAEAGILLSTDNVAKLDAASVFTKGNGRNVVEIIGDYVGESNQRNTVITWAGFADKTPYRLMKSVAVRSGWKLNPGVTIESARDVSIAIDETGYLNAVGTATQKVRFVGAENSRAYWKGILCYSPSANNRIENGEIMNAGSTGIVAGSRANLAIYGSDSHMTVTNTRISGSGGYGILVSSDARLNDDAATSNTFDGNAQANIKSDY